MHLPPSYTTFPPRKHTPTLAVSLLCFLLLGNLLVRQEPCGSLGKKPSSVEIDVTAVGVLRRLAREEEANAREVFNLAESI
jgi:hypothetical protein